MSLIHAQPGHIYRSRLAQVDVTIGLHHYRLIEFRCEPVLEIQRVAGAEVAEVYVQPVKPSVMRPVKELKSFAKVMLKPGEQRKVSVHLDQASFSFYDPDKKGWVAEKGDYQILVGASSRNLSLTGDRRLAETKFARD